MRHSLQAERDEHVCNFESAKCGMYPDYMAGETYLKQCSSVLTVTVHKSNPVLSYLTRTLFKFVDQLPRLIGQWQT